MPIGPTLEVQEDLQVILTGVEDNTQEILDGDKGDITVSSTGTVWSINNNAVVEAKINTGAVTETKIADSAVTENKVANNAITVNKIANDSVTNSKLANMATATIKGRATAGTGDPEDLAIDNDLASVSANDDTIPSAKAVKAYVDLLELKTRIRNAGLINGFIRVTVASNNLTVAVSTSPTSQVDPTASNPVYVFINGVLRSITGALSVTANAGTNWLNMGSAELATREVDLFTFMQWNSTTSAVNILVSRLPYPRLMGDFTNSGTTEKGVFGIVNYNATDVVVNIGRFAATLSAGAGYTWTVPTFTNANLIQEPIYETRRLDYLPTYSGDGALTYTSVTTNQAYYQIIGRNVFTTISAQGTTGGTVSASIITSMPFVAIAGDHNGTVSIRDSISGAQVAGWGIIDGNTNLFYVRKIDTTNYGLGTGRNIRVRVLFPII